MNLVVVDWGFLQCRCCTISPLRRSLFEWDIFSNSQAAGDGEVGRLTSCDVILRERGSGIGCSVQGWRELVMDKCRGGMQVCGSMHGGGERRCENLSYACVDGLCGRQWRLAKLRHRHTLALAVGMVDSCVERPNHAKRVGLVALSRFSLLQGRLQIGSHSEISV
jgi:hypothetical protein